MKCFICNVPLLCSILYEKVSIDVASSSNHKERRKHSVGRVPQHISHVSNEGILCDLSPLSGRFRCAGKGNAPGCTQASRPAGAGEGQRGGAWIRTGSAGRSSCSRPRQRSATNLACRTAHSRMNAAQRGFHPCIYLSTEWR